VDLTAMAVDYAEKEREFLEGLEADTGRDLAQWMRAIAATGLTDRNAIIDWLRQQGFLFARASWMERIHHNGGRPIYLDAAALASGGEAADKPVAAVRAPAPSAPAPAAPPVAVVPALASRAPAPVAPPVPRRRSAEDETSLDEVLAEAKGYRPLAQLLLRDIQSSAPQATFAARDGYIAVLTADGALAGVITVSGKELRLALALGAKAVLPPFSKPKFAKAQADIPGAFTHMVVLTDARQVTPDLLAAVVEAVKPA
jgi:pyruvate/2-oxoglutarate dehydrogenase complex dihydrolipoamide acyltransferase (E2) component